MTKKTKEQQQLELEKKRKLREKQMLQLKASNEMLEDAKKAIIKRYGEGSDTANDLIEQINIAQDQNIERGSTYLRADKDEIESGTYNEVSQAEADAYYARLKNLGKDDELLHIKNVEEFKKRYNEIKNKNVATPAKKSKTKLEELTEKLKQLKSGNQENDTVEQTGESSKVCDIEKDYAPQDSDNKKTENIAVERVTELEDDYFRLDSDEVYPDFDPRDIPSYIQYDMIPLPSRGECYAHKKARIPVAYLTAADENLITSRNLYNSGSMIDIILERKILDKSIRVADLCQGDRDAIAIWLRATAYGPDYPVVAPYKGEEIETMIDLNNIEYLPFDLKGDENGWFKYKVSNGDVLKYKILTHGDEENLTKHNNIVSEVINKSNIVKNMENSIDLLDKIDVSDKEDIVEALNVVKNKIAKIDGDPEDVKRNIHSTYITDKMYMQTMSVNGNTDREFIKNYINNMRAKDAFDYRMYMGENIPGVNLSITVPIPESMGGGSFNTFLSIGETIFINV